MNYFLRLETDKLVTDARMRMTQHQQAGAGQAEDRSRRRQGLGRGGGGGETDGGREGRVLEEFDDGNGRADQAGEGEGEEIGEGEGEREGEGEGERGLDGQRVRGVRERRHERHERLATTSIYGLSPIYSSLAYPPSLFGKFSVPYNIKVKQVCLFVSLGCECRHVRA